MSTFKTPADQTTNLSEDSPFRDRAPSLAICLNLPHKDDPKTTKDWSATVPGTVAKEHVDTILAKVCTRLTDKESFKNLWDCDAGFAPKRDGLPRPDADQSDEMWARYIDELVLGTAYTGPDIISDFMGVTHPMQYIYSRFSLGAGGAAGSDPAVPIGVACQHMATYGALARGIAIDDLQGGGITASQATGTEPLWRDGTRGKWYDTSGTDVKYQQMSAGQPETVKRHPLTNAQDPSSLVKEVAEFGPGTVYTYNPLRYETQRKVWVSPDQVSNPNAKPDEKVAKPGVGSKMEQEAVQQTVSWNKFTGDMASTVKKYTGVTVQFEQANPIAAINAMGAQGDGKVLARVTLGMQAPGSHASMVLRVYKTSSDKVAVQMLDSGSHIEPAGVGANRATQEQLNADYVAFALTAGDYSVGSGGHVVSEASVNLVPGMNENFVGLGTVPVISNWSEVEKLLENARPVGLARFGVAIRSKDNTAMDESAILFVSRMIPMWQANPFVRFSIARLMWSLRQTPYCETLQPFWAIYAPTGPLADIMWRPDARGKTLDQMCDYAVAFSASPEAAAFYKSNPKKLEGLKRSAITSSRDLVPIAIVSNDAAGNCQEVWRNYCLKGPHGQGVTPKAIKDVFALTGWPDLHLFEQQKNDFLKLIDQEVELARVQRQGLLKTYEDAANAERKAAPNATDDQKKATKDACKAWEDEIKKPWKLPDAAQRMQTWAKDIAHSEDAHPLQKVRDNPLASWTSRTLSPSSTGKPFPVITPPALLGVPSGGHDVTIEEKGPLQSTPKQEAAHA